MLTVVLGPFDAEIIVDGGFLTELCGDDILYHTKTLYILSRRSVGRHEILFIAASERISKAVGDREVLVDLILRSYVEQELSLLLVVLILTFTIVQHPVRVCQTFKSKT